MDYLTIVTAAGKCLFVESGNRSKTAIVRREKIATRTGTEMPHPAQKRQHLFLTLASPHAK